MIWVALGCCLTTAAMPAWSQSARKPGLWEITSTRTWQKSPFPPNTPTGADAPGGGPHTLQVCLTQEMIDKYGAALPQSRDCRVANLVKTPGSMKADWICSGHLNGKGTLESTETEPDHTTGKVHFVGTMLMGQESKPVELTVDSTGVFKSSDCGTVKPYPMPPE
jgi:hypothetical protein